jgi:hypothetical protein
VLGGAGSAWVARGHGLTAVVVPAKATQLEREVLSESMLEAIRTTTEISVGRMSTSGDLAVFESDLVQTKREARGAR